MCGNECGSVVYQPHSHSSDLLFPSLSKTPQRKVVSLTLLHHVHGIRTATSIISAFARSRSPRLQVEGMAEAAACRHPTSSSSPTLEESREPSVNRELALTNQRVATSRVNISEPGKSSTLNLAVHAIWYILCIPSKLVAALVVVARIPFVAAMETGDDFSNNLFSDLAPILTLFGEQVITTCAPLSND